MDDSGPDAAAPAAAAPAGGLQLVEGLRVAYEAAPKAADDVPDADAGAAAGDDGASLEELMKKMKSL